MTELKHVQEFLSHNRIAILGVSRDPRDFSRVLFREFVDREYDVVPVNPLISMIEDRHCYGELKEITPPVEAVVLMTPPAVTEDVIKQCHDAGIKSIWFYRAAGTGAVSANAVSYCKEHHIQVIEGHCPMMFLPNSGAIHRVHRLFLKLAGSYPK
ncbi:MAG: CoA-binding protein [Candidatus Zixiibacteriota bacterium]